MEGLDPLSEKAFGSEVNRLGYPAEKTKHGMMRNGMTPFTEEGEGR